MEAIQLVLQEQIVEVPIVVRCKWGKRCCRSLANTQVFVSVHKGSFHCICNISVL